MSHFILQNDPLVQRAFQNQINKDNRTDINRLWRRVNELSSMANPRYGGGVPGSGSGTGTGTGSGTGTGTGTGSGSGYYDPCNDPVCSSGLTNGGLGAWCFCYWTWNASMMDWTDTPCSSQDGNENCPSATCMSKPTSPGILDGDICPGICCWNGGSGSGPPPEAGCNPGFVDCSFPAACTVEWNGSAWVEFTLCIGIGCVCHGDGLPPGSFVGETAPGKCCQP